MCNTQCPDGCDDWDDHERNKGVGTRWTEDVSERVATHNSYTWVDGVDCAKQCVWGEHGEHARYGVVNNIHVGWGVRVRHVGVPECTASSEYNVAGVIGGHAPTQHDVMCELLCGHTPCASRLLVHGTCDVARNGRPHGAQPVGLRQTAIFHRRPH